MLAKQPRLLDATSRVAGSPTCRAGAVYLMRPVCCLLLAQEKAAGHSGGGSGGKAGGDAALMALSMLAVAVRHMPPERGLATAHSLATKLSANADLRVREVGGAGCCGGLASRSTTDLTKPRW